MMPELNKKNSLKRSLLLSTAFIYVVCLHLSLGYLILHPHSHEMIQRVLKAPKQELTKHYERMIYFHKRIDANLKPGSVLFIGDSHIQGLCVTCVTSNAVNFGIGNDTTYGVYNRLHLYKSIHTAKAVVFEVGVNDLNRRSVEEALSHFKAIIKSIPSKTSVILTAVFPIDPEFATKKGRSNTKILKLNAGLKSICTKYHNCTFIDISSDIQDSKGNLKEFYHIGDGLHLSPSGYKIWINELKRALNPD